MLPHNPAMARNDNYKWDGDSKDERASEFAHSGYSTTSAGVFHSTWAQQRMHRQRKRRARLAGILWPVAVAVAASAALLYGLISHLRG